MAIYLTVLSCGPVVVIYVRSDACAVFALAYAGLLYVADMVAMCDGLPYMRKIAQSNQGGRCGDLNDNDSINNK